MKLLFFLLGLIALNAQSVSKDKKIILELSIVSDNSTKISNPNPAFAVGFWYRYPAEMDTRLELGGGFKSGATIYNFDYGKNGNYYRIESKGYILNIGGRLVKEFLIKNQKIEWLTELTFNTLFVDGSGIPDNPAHKTKNDNTIQITIDAESISTLKIGQGIRIWNKNIGFGIKASITPYKLWYKTTIPKSFNVFSAEATLSLKI